METLSENGSKPFDIVDLDLNPGGFSLAKSNPWWFTVTNGLLLSLSLLTNLGSLIYIKIWLKINHYVATILTLETVFKLVLMLLALIGFCVMEHGNLRTFQLCSFHILPILASFMASYLFPSATSVIR